MRNYENRSSENRENANANKASVVQLISSIITIFIFITGINNFPSLVGAEVSDSVFTIPEFSFSISFGILLLTQAVYYISFYMILRFIHIKINHDKEMDLEDAKTIFYMIIFALFGLSGAIMFFEGFWGPVSLIMENGNLLYFILYFIFSLGLNFITIYSAFKMKVWWFF